MVSSCYKSAQSLDLKEIVHANKNIGTLLKLTHLSDFVKYISEKYFFNIQVKTISKSESYTTCF